MMPDNVDLSRQWDAIVVGTGMGGATIGSTLAKKGFSVLFLEKGGHASSSKSSLEETTPEGRLATGWWPNRLSRLNADGSHSNFFAAIGCAVGGSSVHYAAALERMAESDFGALNTKSGNLAPWPIDFAEFEQYYAEAEKLFSSNELPLEDLLRRMSDWDRAFFHQMQENGLNPDALHVAMRYDDDCKECIGTICPRKCKSDALSACLDGALRLPNCQIIHNCDVQLLEADATKVRAIRATRGGNEVRLSAKIVILAAGALHSPPLLLRSTNQHWPNGLANRSDQVGRNLMFHTSDLFAVWSPHRLNRQGRQKKSLSLRDFYIHKGQRLGYVQSMGLDANRGLIAHFLKGRLRQWGLQNEMLLALFVKVPSFLADVLYGNAKLFVGSTEDDPDPNNRITLDSKQPDGATFTYAITDDLRSRSQGLYREFSHRVQPWKVARVSHQLEINYGHPCGTCRFGNDPHNSVLDLNCRAHDIDNLYVVDSSFMPRSGAVNPSLTIAANALRVARHVAREIN